MQNVFSHARVMVIGVSSDLKVSRVFNYEHADMDEITKVYNFRGFIFLLFSYLL